MNLIFSSNVVIHNAFFFGVQNYHFYKRNFRDFNITASCSKTTTQNVNNNNNVHMLTSKMRLKRVKRNLLSCELTQDAPENLRSAALELHQYTVQFKNHQTININASFSLTVRDYCCNKKKLGVKAE